MKRVAVLGMGRMGQGIAASLLRSGFTVIVWNRTIEKAAPVVESGAILAQSIKEAAEQADFIIGMVADDLASAAIWMGPDGALQSAASGTFIIECSTLSYDHVQSLAAAA